MAWTLVTLLLATPATQPLPPIVPPAIQRDRNGAFLSLGAGAGSCAAPMCAAVRALGLGRMELGYRWHYVALFASGSYGGSPLAKVGGGASKPEGWIRMFDAGVGALVYLLPHRFVDPYVGATLGYFRMTAKEDRIYTRYSRGAVRPTVGFDLLPTEHLALGPRFDAILPFAGEYCTGTKDDPGCTDIADLVDAEDSALARRLLRRAFPKPWFVSLQIRVTF